MHRHFCPLKLYHFPAYLQLFLFRVVERGLFLRHGILSNVCAQHERSKPIDIPAQT